MSSNIVADAFFQKWRQPAFEISIGELVPPFVGRDRKRRPFADEVGDVPVAAGVPAAINPQVLLGRRPGMLPGETGPFLAVGEQVALHRFVRHRHPRREPLILRKRAFHHLADFRVHILIGDRRVNVVVRRVQQLAGVTLVRPTRPV